MRIEFSALQRVPAVTQPSNPADASSSPAADHATLSRIGAAASRVAGSDSVRMDLVERIRAQIEAGTYHVSPRAIARKLIDTMLRTGQ